MRDASQLRPIGDLRVSALGMGAMTLTQRENGDPSAARRVVGAALEAGVTLFDTADSYGATGVMGANESALADALRSIPGGFERVIVATKGGHTRGPRGTWWIDGTPGHLASAARLSCQRLGLDSLPLYQHHRPDPRSPFEDSMGALAQLVTDGVVQRVGVSNVSLTQLEVARNLLGSALVSVQNECSLGMLEHIPVLARCESLGLAFLAWGPLGGMREAKRQADGIDVVASIAAERNLSVQRLALAWLLSLSPALIPIPGASRPESIRDSAAAVSVELSAAERTAIDCAVGLVRSAEGLES